MKYEKFKLYQLFDTFRGNFHVSAILDKGEIPLISCSAEDNGTEGYFDIPKDKRFSNALTIASDGRPLTTFYHNYEFGAKDNVIVCVPNEKMPEPTIIYTAAKIDAQKWRFSYGRKCYLNKIDKIEIKLPINADKTINHYFIKKSFDSPLKIPEKHKTKDVNLKLKFKKFNVTDFFDLERGDFHSIDALSVGKYPTVSRDTQNNGIVGYYEKPEGAKLYPKFTITVSTVSGDAFVQFVDFIATDNVLVCIPKKRLKPTTILLIESMINKAKWRYSYGRQCYKRVFAKTEIYLPVTSSGALDESSIEHLIKNTSYWAYVNKFIPL